MDRLGDLSQFYGHTEGPWEFDPKANLNVRKAGRGGRSIGSTGGYSDSSDVEGSYQQNIANARLVAAAPDLLAALKESRKENEELRERMWKAIEYAEFAQGASPDMKHIISILKGQPLNIGADWKLQEGKQC